MLVIDCKIDPAYVLKDINDWEVEALLERSSDRYKESWEKARFIAFFSAYAQRLKKLIAVHTLYAFPWEEENVEKPKAPSRERMREMAREAQEEYDKYKRGELKPAKF